jgi:hypothetical protein
MEKIKEKLHIGSSRRKSQPDNETFASDSKTTHSTTFGSNTSSGGVGTIEGTLLLHPHS